MDNTKFGKNRSETRGASKELVLCLLLYGKCQSFSLTEVRLRVCVALARRILCMVKVFFQWFGRLFLVAAWSVVIDQPSFILDFHLHFFSSKLHL